MIGPDIPAQLLAASSTRGDQEHTSENEGPSSIRPQIPEHLLAPSSAKSCSDASDDDGPAPIGPQIPTHIAPSSARSTTPPLAPSDSRPAAVQEEEEDEDDYMPALPPDLAAARTSSAKPIKGPTLPPSVAGRPYDEDSDEEDVGPKPLPQGYVIEEKDGVQEFLEREERRRKQLEEASKKPTLKREEWMLVPPTSSDLLGYNSLWTETPAERQQRIADEVAGKRRRAADVDPTEDTDPDARKRRRYEEEVRRGVEEHTKKVRGPTLIEQHERLSSVKEAEKARSGETDEPPAIWDHSRDMALGGRLMDDKTRDKFIKEARGLGDRFGSGKSSFL
ncbi:hypothetical protein BN946_scf184829.g63 [Trametes cinnabarina]|uniref:DUF3752 domain-containing protein n=1 Tax=Pycnoporus cinnabarinus TaxID=5643 RepID=A0A060SFD5_PYCCI|nr:hypothetical protein BN946_scf184829.g63 [Trametes cinnabarina]